MPKTSPRGLVDAGCGHCGGCLSAVGHGDRKSYEFFEVGCSFFPKTIIAPSFIEPAVSDIPTLFIQGDLDAATPPSQARTVSHLTNATFVLFGSEGQEPSSKTPSCSWRHRRPIFGQLGRTLTEVEPVAALRQAVRSLRG
ncbi:MAG: alpha/beta hydrolase [Anaerolineae bacterium]